MSTTPTVHKLLRIYLSDHRAGATAGLALARRACDGNRGTPYHGPMASIASDIEADVRLFDRILDALDVTPDVVKRVLALTAERLGRLKLNGRLVGYSPLSRIIELEGLVAGVGAKLHLWVTLEQASGRLPALDGFDLTDLQDRAKDQLERLSSIHALALDEMPVKN